MLEHKSKTAVTAALRGKISDPRDSFQFENTEIGYGDL